METAYLRQAKMFEIEMFINRTKLFNYAKLN